MPRRLKFDCKLNGEDAAEIKASEADEICRGHGHAVSWSSSKQVPPLLREIWAATITTPDTQIFMCRIAGGKDADIYAGDVLKEEEVEIAGGVHRTRTLVTPHGKGKLVSGVYPLHGYISS